jgi:predicted transcriptional regulator
MAGNKESNDKNRIVIHEGSRILIASSEKDIQVLSSPQRQRILRLLQNEKKPLHGKEIGEKLGLKAASAHFHLKKLEEIGVINQSHTQVINGITARYYEASVDSVIIGEDFIEATDDDFIKQKMLFIHNTFNTNRDTFIKSLHQTMLQEQSGNITEKKLHLLLDFKLFLSVEEVENLQKDMEEILSKYSKPSSGKSTYSVCLSVMDESE